jgi:hypothetical protein
MLVKHLTIKNIMVFFNIMILSQNFKNNLFQTPPKQVKKQQSNNNQHGGYCFLSFIKQHS